MDDHFNPPLPFRNPHIQTILGSSRFRARGAQSVFRDSVTRIIDAGQGVRLLGFHSRQPGGCRARGLVALLHGWEGSTDSSYILSLGKYLYHRGYDIFRLNLRDHGDSHHLNEGLFHGALTDETFTALRNIAQMAQDLPFFLVGFSLGGNYALRVALRQTDQAIPNLRHVIAVSPALDPLKSTRCIDGGPSVYRYYFLQKWKTSLKKKQTLFPQRYDFGKLMQHKTCMGLTEAIMPYYPDFSDYRSYFRQYTLLGAVFSTLAVPVTIVASQDDPVVPVGDFQELAPHPLLKLYIHRHGGHCGFLDAFPSSCWHEKMTHQILESHALGS